MLCHVMLKSYHAFDWFAYLKFTKTSQMLPELLFYIKSCKASEI